MDEHTFDAAIRQAVWTYGTDADADRITRGYAGDTVVERVSSPDATGRITVTLWHRDGLDTYSRDVQRTDSQGGLPIGAGVWLRLGDCSQSTRRARAVRYFTLGR